MKPGAVTAEKIREALRRRYSGLEWAAFSELHLGMSAGRRGQGIDFYAINCWGSKRHYTVGIEIKVSRGDFLHELRQPDKRAVLEDYSNEAWFVTTKGVAKEEELPEGWGLMTCSENLQLRTVRAAKHRKFNELPLWFVSMLARRMKQRDSQAPKKLWKYLGQDLTEEEMLKVVEDAFDAALGVERKRIEMESHSKFRQTEGYKKLEGLRDKLCKFFDVSAYHIVKEGALDDLLAGGVAEHRLQYINGEVVTIRRAADEIARSIGKAIDKPT